MSGAQCQLQLGFTKLSPCSSEHSGVRLTDIADFYERLATVGVEEGLRCRLCPCPVPKPPPLLLAEAGVSLLPLILPLPLPVVLGVQEWRQVWVCATKCLQSPRS